MTRTEITQRVSNLKATIVMLETAAQTGCKACQRFAHGQCETFGKVPDDFIPQGCDQWDFMDCPF